ncbi:hypothetical protein KR018_010077, partial [Drosophila ironensis]
EQAVEEVEEEEEAEEAEEPQQADNSLLERMLSPESAVVVLASRQAPSPNPSDAIDSDDELSDEDQSDEGDGEREAPQAQPLAMGEDSTPRFRQRNIPATRSYRRVQVELIHDGLIAEAPPDAEEVPAHMDQEEQEEQEDAEPEVPSPEGEPAYSLTTDSEPEYHLSSDMSASEVISPPKRKPCRDLSSCPFQSDEDGVYAPNSAERQQIEDSVSEVMCKAKPVYTWNSVQELMWRENNIVNRIGWRGGHTSAESFNRGFYGSRQAVEQLAQLSSLNEHGGCVNCLNFNRTGDLICSGSDDLRVIVWDWAKGKQRHSIRTGHTMNIFQAKFMDINGCLDIVTASRDGHVRRAIVPPSGEFVKPVRLYSHTDSVHKLVVVPQNRYEVMSAGEDSAVKHFDLRLSGAPTTMLRVVNNDERRGGCRVRLFSIAHHPFMPEFVVCGSDDKVRVYDKRKLTQPCHEMIPREVLDNKITQITCGVYNYSGSEILASYSDDWIYLFDSRNYTEGESLHCYKGHINNRTIKGVNFFGPRSEYIVSGSDCGNIFFWDKNTEAVLKFMKGDHAGVVNCLEPHPFMPVLATSGLEHDVKIWAPKGPDPTKPQTEVLKNTLQRNFERNVMDMGDFDINQFQYFIRQFLQSPPGTRRTGRENYGARPTGRENSRTRRTGRENSSTRRTGRENSRRGRGSNED